MGIAAVCVAPAISAETITCSIVRVGVTPDGSATPPGDLLEVEMLAASDDSQFSLEIHAFAASNDKNGQIKAVLALGEANKDAKGAFLLKSNLKDIEKARSQEAAAVGNKIRRFTAKIVIPYAQLDLPLGSHRLGYAINLKRGETIIETRLTKLYPVTITKESRKTMTVKTEKLVSKPREETTEKAFVVRDNRPEIEVFTRSATLMAPTFDMHEASVDIPRGWQRPAAAPAAIVPEDPEGRFHAMAEGPWFPLQKATVYYGTNRKMENADEPSRRRFGNKVSDTVQYGSCLVNIPVEHRRGDLELPSNWNPWARQDPQKHFFVETLNLLSDESFTEVLRSRLISDKQDVLLFVHGFANSFDDAVLKMEQLSYDINFRGMPLVFSWPSEGVVSPNAYKRDEEKATASVSALAKTLSLLVHQRRSHDSPIGKIHILAHSMGNRVLLDALYEIRSTLAENEAKPFGHVIFAAPDVDVAAFAAHFAPVAAMAESTSLYFCPDDMALRMSKKIHKESVVGLRWLFLNPLENIDATNADTSFLGHSYYSASREVLIDLQLLILQGLRPPQRVTLRPAVALQHEYWLFP